MHVNKKDEMLFFLVFIYWKQCKTCHDYLTDYLRFKLFNFTVLTESHQNSSIAIITLQRFTVSNLFFFERN